jgi:hypothetical protein
LSVTRQDLIILPATIIHSSVIKPVTVTLRERSILLLATVQV